MRLLVSACLLGEACRYDGSSSYKSSVAKFCDMHKVYSICPECAGGLQTPRPSAEIVNNRVLTQGGNDVTQAFVQGGFQAARLVEDRSIDMAILKSKSPSCGVTQVYDGTFSGHLIPGEGFAARALREAGCIAIDETHIEKCMRVIQKPARVMGSGALADLLRSRCGADKTAASQSSNTPVAEKTLPHVNSSPHQEAEEGMYPDYSGLTIVSDKTSDMSDFERVLQDKRPCYSFMLNTSAQENVSDDLTGACRTGAEKSADVVALTMISTSPILLGLCLSYLRINEAAIVSSQLMYGGMSALEAYEFALNVRVNHVPHKPIPRSHVVSDAQSGHALLILPQDKRGRSLSSKEVQIGKLCVDHLFEIGALLA